MNSLEWNRRLHKSSVDVGDVFNMFCNILLSFELSPEMNRTKQDLGALSKLLLSLGFTCKSSAP